MTNFDYIIIGAGSAGCVLANKLSSFRQFKVLLIEAGKSDDNFFIKMPVGYGKTFYDKSINWCYNSEKEPNLNERKIFWPRGKTLGGSSSINGLVYHRGQSSDYDDWEKEDNPGWNYQSLLPFFSEYEQIINQDIKLQENKLSINYVEKDYHAVKSIFYETCDELKLKYSKNSYLEGEGVGPYFINTYNGIRHSSSRAFLKPIMNRKNLKILQNSLVNKIIFKNRKAIGVKLQKIINGKKVEEIYYSNKEIILSAGAVNSPQLLQVSGIGPGNLLSENGIDVLYNNPYVGKNLQDHIGISYFYKSKIPTLNSVFGSWSGILKSGLNYVLNRKGPFSVGVNNIGGLLKTSDTLSSCNMQLYLNPHSYQIKLKNERRLFKPDKFNGFNYSYNSCRPSSTGSIEIVSSNIMLSPKIKPNYLSTDKDINDVLKMSRFIGKLQETTATRSILSEKPKLALLEMSDNDIIEDYKKRASTVFHPCGTCKMSKNNNNSVVNDKLEVHGFSGLRVVDASVFPNITSANINAPTIMLAHKASKIILNK